MRLTKKAFIEWLEEQPPEREFGRRSWTRCPLGVCGVETDCRLELPVKWMEQFTRAVDRDYFKPITAAQALELLR